MYTYTQKDNGVTIQALPPGTCNVDHTWEALDHINTMTRTHLWLRDFIVIFNSFCIDVTFYSLLIAYCYGRLKGHAGFLGLLICSGSKTIMQEYFFVFEQPHGFNWYFPGIYSLCVPYHDISDFYFSGHISTGIVFTYMLR